MRYDKKDGAERISRQARLSLYSSRALPVSHASCVLRSTHLALYLSRTPHVSCALRAHHISHTTTDVCSVLRASRILRSAARAASHAAGGKPHLAPHTSFFQVFLPFPSTLHPDRRGGVLSPSPDLPIRLCRSCRGADRSQGQAPQRSSPRTSYYRSPRRRDQRGWRTRSR
jgi:hypothetical protein